MFGLVLYRNRTPPLLTDMALMTDRDFPYPSTTLLSRLGLSIGLRIGIPIHQQRHPLTTVLISMVVLMMKITIGSHFLVNVPCILQLSKGGIVNG